MAAQPVPIVDWEAVKEELDAIDDSWKQPRFDSLTHVVEVLTSQNPEEATRTLREQRDAIEALVDDVVRGYHKGFNKAIHNYSQILRLFSESATSLSGLKVNLADCKKLLGTRHKQLQQQWYRSVTLRNVITLLDQIDNVAKVPARIEQLITGKKYYAAVQLHIQSISMLEREGIQGVGALQDVRSELSKLRGTLFFKVVEDLHSHLYNKGEYSTDVNGTHNADDDLSIIESVMPPVGPVSRRTRTFKTFDIQLSNGSSDGHVVGNRRKSGSNDNSLSIDSKDDENSQTGDAVDGGASESGGGPKEVSADKVAFKEKRAGPAWLADATPSEFVEAVTKSDASLNVKYLQTMVECLSLLGKTAAGGAIISQRLRQTVHDLITDEIKARAASIEASRPRVEVSRMSSGYRNGTVTPLKKVQESRHSTKSSMAELAPSIGPTGPAQIVAHQLVESILEILGRVLENHVTVEEALENKSANKAHLQNGESDARSTGGYSLAFALTVIQNECQQLICDILRASPDAASADAAVQTARLSKAPTDQSNGTSADGLSFAFRFTDTAVALPGATVGGDVARPARRKSSPGAQEGYGTGAVLVERGVYLIAAVYRPVLEFTDKVSSLLPQKYVQLGKEGLQSFIETFIKDQFLPLVYVDYRTRVADALASSAAFRPKAHSTSEETMEKSPIALLGPFVADQLASEVVAWAHAMPKYAAEFLELVQTILERTLERCRAAYTEAVLGTLSSSIIGRTDVEKLMKQEPANDLLEGKAIGSVLDAEDMEVEMEMNNLLLSLRPIRQDQLIKDDHKFVLLAALSESLDSLSASIEQFGQKIPSAQRKKEVRSGIAHHRRTSSALTAGLYNLIEKYHDLSLESLRTLRIEMQLQAIYHLQSMTGRVYVSDQDAEEPEDFILTLTTQISRWDEEMAPYIPAAKRTYAFGGICGVSATAFIKALNDMSLVNVFGVRQICRNCIGLQQALAALSSSSGDMVQQRLDLVRTYYELLTMPFEALIAFVAEHDSEFSFTEFSNLLQVNVPGREIPADAFQRIGRILAPGGA